MLLGCTLRLPNERCLPASASPRKVAVESVVNTRIMAPRSPFTKRESVAQQMLVVGKHLLCAATSLAAPSISMESARRTMVTFKPSSSRRRFSSRVPNRVSIFGLISMFFFI